MTEKNNNFFSRMFSRIREWYNERAVRKVFLFFLAAALICLIFAKLDSSGMVSNASIICGIICLGASALDTLISRRRFKFEIDEICRSYFVRSAENFEHENAVPLPDCFSAEDLGKIKAKKRAYLGDFLIKTLIMIFLIALLFRVF